MIKSNYITDDCGKNIGYTVPTAFGFMNIFLVDDEGNYTLRGEYSNFDYFCTSIGAKYKLNPVNKNVDPVNLNEDVDLGMSLDKALCHIRKELIDSILNNTNTFSTKLDAINLVNMGFAIFDIRNYYSCTDVQFEFRRLDTVSVYEFSMTIVFEDEVKSYFKGVKPHLKGWLKSAAVTNSRLSFNFETQLLTVGWALVGP